MDLWDKLSGDGIFRKYDGFVRLTEMAEAEFVNNTSLKWIKVTWLSVHMERWSGHDIKYSLRFKEEQVYG